MQADGQTDRYDGAKSFNYEYDRDLNLCGYYLCVYAELENGVRNDMCRAQVPHESSVKLYLMAAGD